VKPSWIVGVALLVAFAFITLNTISTEGTGSSGLAAGAALPPFAAPLATGALDGDANVATAAGQGSAGSRPACDVRGPDVVNSCALADRGPVVLTFLAEPVEDCRRQAGVVDRVARRFPHVGFVIVAARGERGALRSRIEAEGWTVPVAYDRDAAVWNAYAVGACPLVTLARSGGVVEESLVGVTGEQELAAKVRALR
jgi:hypothetical protein